MNTTGLKRKSTDSHQFNDNKLYILVSVVHEVDSEIKNYFVTEMHVSV